MDFSEIECTDEEKNNYKHIFSSLLTQSVIAQLKLSKICIVPKSEFEGQLPLNLKNIVFVLVEKSSNFAQNTLRSVLKLILETAEQQRLTSITMVRIHRAG